MASGGLCPASRNRRHEVWGNKEGLETRMPSCPTGRLGAEPLTRVGGQSPGAHLLSTALWLLVLDLAHIGILVFVGKVNRYKMAAHTPQGSEHSTHRHL